jgi:DNA-binding NtrC family response regulator
MPPRVIVIEEGAESVGPGCLRFLNDHACCEIRKWESFAPESTVPATAHLIVAHTANDAEKAVPFFHWLRKKSLRIPVLAVLPQSANEELLQSVSEVAHDFVFAPLREKELRLRLTRILGPQPNWRDHLQKDLTDEACLAQLAGRHPAFLRAVEKVGLFASTGAPVLISGETGTGKELFAHAIHSLSARREGPFIPADCSTLPEPLAENELFGHRRGAFTDAHADQKGLAGMAEHGTLFLDEIDALSQVTQSKLLRFVQEGCYRSLGADRFTAADVRIIAATNLSLEECVHQKQFRSDLYFRLNVLRLDLPPLRERVGDVSLLAQNFAAHIGGEGQFAGKTISPSALLKLENHPWLGNVRELVNVVQRACVYCPGPEIQACHVLLGNEEQDAPPHDSLKVNFRNAKKNVVEKFEREFIEQLLVRHSGNVTQAAREAGKERRAFGRMIKKYGITTETGRQVGKF